MPAQHYPRDRAAIGPQRRPAHSAATSVGAWRLMGCFAHGSHRTTCFALRPKVWHPLSIAAGRRSLCSFSVPRCSPVRTRRRVVYKGQASPTPASSGLTRLQAARRSPGKICAKPGLRTSRPASSLPLKPPSSAALPRTSSSPASPSRNPPRATAPDDRRSPPPARSDARSSAPSPAPGSPPSS